MSASPSVPPLGSTPQNGTGAPKMIRRKKNDNPMVAPKRRPAPLTKTSIPPRKPTKQSNGATRKEDLIEPRALNEEALMEQIKPIIFNDEASASGFTDRNLKEGSYEDLELWTTKRELREGFRHHMARFIAKKSIDPRKEDDFQRPVRLHRRDPKTKMLGKVEENGKLEPNGIENKEIEEWRAKREEEREANLAQIAPDALTGQKRKKISQQKAAEVHGVLQTDEQKARGILRYEEALPWHFEDFDNKNTWVGSYEEAMSGVNAVLTFQNGRVTMVPLEKWYKFTRKDMFKTMNIEEVEKSFQKKSKEPRWMMDHREKESEKKDQVAMARINRGLYVGKEAKDEVSRPGGKKHDDDADEIDADGADEFADDEEDALFEADEEESKAIQKRIKKDQLQANIFNLKAEKEYEIQERLEEKEKEAEKISGKAMRKALKKREKRFVYQSDEDDYNPFSDSSSSTDSEEDRARDAAARLAEQERRAKEKAAVGLKAPNAPPSGASSKGTNTPSGRPKHSDPLATNPTKSKNKLKRPGSPDLSEMSGTDTSRKKHKKKHPSGTGTSTPQPGSRPMSPVFSTATSAPNVPTTSSSQPQRKSSIIKLNVAADPAKLSSSQPLPKKRSFINAGAGAGSASEGEGAATAGSGPEMSDGGTTIKKRLKLNPPGSKSPKGTTPVGSRAGSPKPAPSKPAGKSPAPGTPGASDLPFPTIAEIHAGIPAEGITTAELSQMFKHRTGGRTKDFIGLVRAAGRYDNGLKKLFPQ